GAPTLAATVISRASLENIFDLAASWRPLRCMMFLNCEWPAMTLLRGFPSYVDEWPAYREIAAIRPEARRQGCRRDFSLPPTARGSTLSRRGQARGRP